ncbi:MAG: leucyl aminopeptidase [Lachnospiraceae bacterium]|nr:leucyl aminopeptidase [Lachnospiraceae bacterium]
MYIQRLVDLEDYEFDTLLVTYNHKNRLSIELGKVSEIFDSLKADGLVGGSKVYGLRGKDFSYQGQPYYNLIFIGIPEKATPRRIQLQFGAAIKEAKRFKGKNLLMTAIGDDIAYWLSSAMKGLLLGDYKFDKYLSSEKEEDELNLGVLTGMDAASFKKEEQYVQMMAKAVTKARDLVNEPANVMTPSALCKAAKEVCDKNNIKFTVLSKEDCEKLGMNAYLSVAKGSKEAPKFIIMDYNGRVTDTDRIALIGKGICFDAGGYNLKPSRGMAGMQGDMGGAAAVIAAMGAIAESKLGINVTGIVAACENLVSGKSMKPGDIVKSMNGKTIEIDNTDAEGRLTLVDAITYAIRECQATSIVDIATLTGACEVALGSRYTGCFSNSDDLLAKILQGSIIAGENIWKLPLGTDEYPEINKSEIADIKNTGNECGAIAAARFINEFVESKPWIHLDIAGTSESKKDQEIYSVGGTGVGAMTLYEFVKLMEKPYKSY